MEIRMFNTDKAPAAVGPYSHAVIAGEMIYVSGQIPVNPATGELVKSGVQDEARQCLENAKAILEEAGTCFEKVVKTTLFIQNMEDFGKINEVYGTYFPEHKPARACVEVAKLPLGIQVEIEMIAAL